MSFPWGAVGAFVGVVTLGIGALKLSKMMGVIEQRGCDHERRLGLLEADVRGVPEEISAEVTTKAEEAAAKLQERAKLAESAEALRCKHLANISKSVTRHDRQLVAIMARCETMHGPNSKVIAIDDTGFDGTDSDEELTLQEPGRDSK